MSHTASLVQQTSLAPHLLRCLLLFMSITTILLNMQKLTTVVRVLLANLTKFEASASFIKLRLLL